MQPNRTHPEGHPAGRASPLGPPGGSLVVLSPEVVTCASGSAASDALLSRCPSPGSERLPSSLDPRPPLATTFAAREEPCSFKVS